MDNGTGKLPTDSNPTSTPTAAPAPAAPKMDAPSRPVVSSGGRVSDMTGGKTKKMVLVALAVLVLGAAAFGLYWVYGREAAPATTTSAVTISYVGPSVGVNYDFDKKIIADFEKKTGIKVNYIAGPESASDRIAQYQENLKTSSANDVILMDVIWPGILANDTADLNSLLPGRAKNHYQAIVSNNTVGGKLVAMPYYTDASVLYYRSDLLSIYGYTKPPTTWDELKAMATKVQAGERKAGNTEFWGYVWQADAYEGLTCNAIELQASYGGGTIIADDGTVSVNNAATAKAFTEAASWIGTISPKTTTTFKEEDSRSIWQSGNALFMRNWPYAYGLGQKSDSIIKDKFSVAVLPTGGTRHADTLGGWQLAISKNSKHQKEAAQFIDYMTSQAVQKQRAVEGSYLPTLSALASDKDIQAANPYYLSLGLVFANNTVARPSTVAKAKYDQVSTAYYTAVNNILTGQATAAVTLPKLETDIKAIMSK